MKVRSEGHIPESGGPKRKYSGDMKKIKSVSSVSFEALNLPTSGLLGITKDHHGKPFRMDAEVTKGATDQKVASIFGGTEEKKRDVDHHRKGHPHKKH